MHRIIRIGFVSFAATMLTAALAIAQDAVAVGKNGEVQFSTDTRVGSMLLKPGHYQFQHRSIDGQNYLIVRERFPVPSGGGTHVVGAGTGREIARVPCRIVQTGTGEKVPATAFYWRKDADGIRRVTRVDIRGEKEGHVIALEPQS
ncbi:MAG TPA: hypothetical protein VI485_03040 [Vicinamibacterales bacterium]|nr:hypothetical protein [Vicinamibacterales bacterium]